MDSWTGNASDATADLEHPAPPAESEAAPHEAAPHAGAAQHAEVAPHAGAAQHAEAAASGRADEDDLRDESHPIFASADRPPTTSSRRVSPGRRRATRRRRRLVPLLALLIIGALVAVSYVLVNGVSRSLHTTTPDYSGTGTATAQIEIHTGDGADAIADTLLAAGVVKSKRAFLNAASDSGQSGNIQPGVYQLHTQSKASVTMAEILDPASRLVARVTIPEGFIQPQVLAAVAAKTKLTPAALTAAAGKPGTLGIPDAFATAKSAEGFYFPATYDIDPTRSATAVLQNMVATFGREAAALDLVGKAKALGLTPYQVLIIASIAQSEAKYDVDLAKVARVIMNRIAAGRPLQVDATSAYAAKIMGLDPTKVIYSELNSPYNSYKHAGLPPTPIGNPGRPSLAGAANPPAGTWLFYVNIDAAGHLGFFTDEAEFTKAADICTKNNWGCG